MGDRKPKIELGKSIYNENETVAFLYEFDSIERCDYYNIHELNALIDSIEDAKKKIKNHLVGQMSFDWRVKKAYACQEEKENNKNGFVGR